MIGAKEHWGHGYGFDALRTLVIFGFREMNLRRVWLRVDANHPRAVALYERLGFRTQAYLEEADWSRGAPRDVLMMVISRAAFDELYGATEEVGDVPRG
jgi:RimJ/RimL family protein N-acetyltransferase